MTPTQQFIEDAIAAGWRPLDFRERHSIHTNPRRRAYLTRFQSVCSSISITEILLDPLAWQAVGKTRGWKFETGDSGNAWFYQWNQFIANLADGLSIDEALAAISQGV